MSCELSRCPMTLIPIISFSIGQLSNCSNFLVDSSNVYLFCLLYNSNTSDLFPMTCTKRADNDGYFITNLFSKKKLSDMIQTVFRVLSVHSPTSLSGQNLACVQFDIEADMHDQRQISVTSIRNLPFCLKGMVL